MVDSMRTSSLFLCLAACCVSSLHAQEQSSDTLAKPRATRKASEEENAKPASRTATPRTKVEKSGKTPDRDSTREQDVFAFVEENHPKLASLLTYLREKRAAEYRQVMKELTRVQLRLKTLATRDQELHGIELKLWKIRSEQRLIAAEMATGKNQKRLEEQLRKLVIAEQDKNLERLKLQRNRVEKQLANLQSQIDRQEGSKDEQIEKSLKQWKNKIARQTSAKKNSAKQKTN